MRVCSVYRVPTLSSQFAVVHVSYSVIFCSINGLVFCVHSVQWCVYITACCDLFIHAAVHIVLVTDLVVLLTERDQKYNLPALLDLKVSINTHLHWNNIQDDVFCILVHVSI